MQGIIIEVNNSEAYVSLQDGRQMCIGLAHLPAGIKAGTNISFDLNTLQMTSHNIGQTIF